MPSSNDIQIDHDPARVGMQRFLLPAALFVKTKQFAGVERCESFVAHGQFRQDQIEIVAAERRNSFGGEHRMRACIQFDQRNVEGAAAQIVDQRCVR